MYNSSWATEAKFSFLPQVLEQHYVLVGKEIERAWFLQQITNDDSLAQ